MNEKNVTRTKCNHNFHASCLFHWITIGHSTCPYCISNLIDKTLNIMTINYPMCSSKKINMKKIYINDIPYFICKDRIFYSVFYRDDPIQSSSDLKESMDFLDEIGIYDKNTNNIIYTHSDIKLIVENNIKYIVTNKNKVFSYSDHAEIGVYKNNQIVIKSSCKNISDNDEYIDLADYCKDGHLYFYFSGQIYRKDNFTKGDLSIIYDDDF
jgi:hypothetical protein